MIALIMFEGRCLPIMDTVHIETGLAQTIDVFARQPVFPMSGVTSEDFDEGCDGVE
jgi:hypothetical protein